MIPPSVSCLVNTTFLLLGTSVCVLVLVCAHVWLHARVTEITSRMLLSFFFVPFPVRRRIVNHITKLKYCHRKGLQRCSRPTAVIHLQVVTVNHLLLASLEPCQNATMLIRTTVYLWSACLRRLVELSLAFTLCPTNQNTLRRRLRPRYSSNAPCPFLVVGTSLGMSIMYCFSTMWCD